eukprot:SAG31_NODE_1296_length_8945_cov_6.341510_6_plen_49_part_00
MVSKLVLIKNHSVDVLNTLSTVYSVTTDDDQRLSTYHLATALRPIVVA